MIKRLGFLVTVITYCALLTGSAYGIPSSIGTDSYYYHGQQSCSNSSVASPSSSATGVTFDDSQSSDTGGVTAIDDDGIDPSPTNSPDHQSTTSYANGQLSALKTSYFALNPGWAQNNGIVLGDVGMLTYKGKTAYAVYGDNHVGDTPHAEISVHAAMALTGVTNPANAENSLSGVHFVIYPNTHQQLNGSVDQSKIDQIGLQASGNSQSSSSSTNTAGCCSTGSTTLTGNDPEQETWNYFKGQGLSDAQTAGIMGNLEQESSFNSEELESGGTTEDPSSVTPATGYGLAQWGSNDIVSEAQSNNVSGPIYSLLTQLNLIMAQLKGKAPYNPSNLTDTLKTIETMTDAGQIATFFDNNFEGGTDPSGTGPGPTDAGPGGVRESDATSILKQYGGTGSTSVNSNTGGCMQSGAVDCTTATGNPKILCEAEQWKGIYYHWSGGHESLAQFQQQCPDLANPPDNQPSGGAVDGDPSGVSGNPSPCAVDCSGLVDLATDMAFGSQGVDMGGVNVAGLQTSPYWKKISFNQLLPGDIVTRITSTDQHTEIVDTFDASTGALVTFGAHQTGTQDGTLPSTTSAWTGAYRYKGPGSTYP